MSLTIFPILLSKKYIAELKKAKKLCKNTPLISMMVMDIKNFIISVQNVEVFGL